MSVKDVWFTCRNPDIQVTALLGQTNPVISDGFGGWTVISRPHRRGLTVWSGRNPMRQQFDIIIEHFRSGETIEHRISALERMASPILENPRRTPAIKIHGDALVYKNKQWVIENLAFGETQRNESGSHRTRQVVTVSLLEYIDGGVLDESNVKPGHGVKPKYRRYTVKHGDTLMSIAHRFLGSHKRWKEIAKLNHIQNPRKPPVGKSIRIPRR